LAKSLAQQTQDYLEKNIQGMRPEEIAVTAFLRMRLGELAQESRAA
jgi:hypothetical protein